MNRLRRIARFLPTEFWALLLVALPMAFVALERLETIHHRPATLSGPNDPDSWLRLTLVRDWLSGGDWYDHEVKRSNAPEGGIASPWTRPLDLVIAGFVQLQPDAAPLTTKLLRTATVLPLFWMLLLMLGLFRAIRQLNPAPMGYITASALVTATPVLWSYFGSGNADHHAPLAALWAWVLSYAIAPDPRPRDIWIQGLLMALMLWISPEALILIAALYAWALLRLLHRAENLKPLRHLTSATACGALLALAIERPPGVWLQPIYDSLSIVHVMLLGLCAAGVRLLALLPERLLAKRAYRLLAAKLGGTGLLLTMGLLYPAFFHGPMAEVSAFILTDFLPRINEAKPLFAKPALYAAALMFLPLCAFAAYAALLRVRAPLVPRGTALQLLFLLSVCLALVLNQMRWNYYLFPLTTLMLAPLVGALFAGGHTWPARVLTSLPATRQAVLRVTVVAGLLGLPLLLFSASPDARTEKGKAVTACESAARRALYSGAVTRALGTTPIILYATTNLGAEVLFFTPYRIVASNYHREGDSIRYVWDSMRIDTDDALRQHFLQRHVQALLVCPDSRAPRDSRLMAWRKGATLPTWLTPVPLRPSAASAPDIYIINSM